MQGYEQFAWFPLCAGLTVLGLIATWFTWRRRGAASGLRLASWSLLPLAAYLTGVIKVLWKMGLAVADWALHLIISPVVWSGIGLAAVAFVGFVVSGALRQRRGPAGAGKSSRKRAAGTTGTEVEKGGQGRGEIEPSPSRSETPADTGSDDDLSDVEDILRKRGIM